MKRADLIGNATFSDGDLQEINNLLAAYVERMAGWSQYYRPAGDVHPLTTLATGVRDIWRRAGGRGVRGGRGTSFTAGDELKNGSLVALMDELLTKAPLKKPCIRTIRRHLDEPDQRRAARATEQRSRKERAARARERRLRKTRTSFTT